jgi:two-component system sensor histidine kinase KdpD
MDIITFKDSPRFRLLRRPIMAAGLVLLVTIPLWRIRDALTLANFSLIYLLLTLVIAVWLGTVPSLTAAFVSFFCFNFFLIKPYYTLTVADPRELLDLFIFLLVALITGQLAAYARRQATVARHRASEQNILYELSSAFNRLNDRQDIYQALRDVVQDNLPLASCAILASHEAAPPTNNNQTTIYLLIGMNEQVYSTLRAIFLHPPTEAQRRFLMACVVQAAMALQRIELAEDVQRSRAIEEADRLKTTLLHAVSHDLRTPITIIKTAASNLQSLRDQMSLAEKQETAQVIEQEADHLDRLVGNLLDMSRLQAGALVLHEDWTAVSEIAGDVAALAWQRHQTARILLVFPDDMPLVRCDHGLILQALNNIADNVLRYEPAESQVEIRGSFNEREVWLTVINHGATIPPEEKARIMEPFYHGQDGHIGLGLAISKGIVEAHRGRIWVEDTPGGGATFGIALPRSPMAGQTNADFNRG